MLKQTLMLAFPMLSVAMAPALATEVNVMSGQAIEAGLVVAVDAFRQQTGNTVKITYATTPQMRQRLGAGEAPDVVIAPPALLDELAKAGKIDSAVQVPVGRVGVGVAVRKGAPPSRTFRPSTRSSTRCSTRIPSSTIEPRAASMSRDC